jgi:secreted trypsin-like serine protease
VLQASICPGDSGGPVVARGTREVVGVVSQSAMDGDETTRNATILARIDVYRSLFATARLVADGADPSELPPLSCAP